MNPASDSSPIQWDMRLLGTSPRNIGDEPITAISIHTHSTKREPVSLNLRDHGSEGPSLSDATGSVTERYQIPGGRFCLDCCRSKAVPTHIPDMLFATLADVHHEPKTPVTWRHLEDTKHKKH